MVTINWWQSIVSSNSVCNHIRDWEIRIGLLSPIRREHVPFNPLINQLFDVKFTVWFNYKSQAQLVCDAVSTTTYMYSKISLLSDGWAVYMRLRLLLLLLQMQTTFLFQSTFTRLEFDKFTIPTLLLRLRWFPLWIILFILLLACVTSGIFFVKSVLKSDFTKKIPNVTQAILLLVTAELTLLHCAVLVLGCCSHLHLSSWLESLRSTWKKYMDWWQVLCVVYMLMFFVKSHNLC